MAFNMSNFQLGSALLSVGLNWWQSVIATLIGHILAAILVTFVSFPGLYYQISFPVSQRFAWGKSKYCTIPKNHTKHCDARNRY